MKKSLEESEIKSYRMGRTAHTRLLVRNSQMPRDFFRPQPCTALLTKHRYSDIDDLTHDKQIFQQFKKMFKFQKNLQSLAVKLQPNPRDLTSLDMITPEKENTVVRLPSLHVHPKHQSSRIEMNFMNYEIVIRIELANLMIFTNCSQYYIDGHPYYLHLLNISSLSIHISMSYSYIPADRKEALVNFKYTGGTDSITYQYLWSPFAEYLLKFVPEWVAPNLITFSALLLLVVVNIIFMLPDEDDVIPKWKLIMMALSILTYQHLDNIDGKQARKTKSSSPLGMLFDHGSDALTAFLLAVQMMKIFHVEFWLQMVSIYIFIMSTYFFAMWSQYSVGYFKLGRINPVDEGLPVYAFFCLVATQIDLKKMASTYHILGTYTQQVVMLLVVLLIPQTIYMTKDILHKKIIPASQILFISWLYISAGITILITYLSLPAVSPSVFFCFFYAIMFYWSRNMINIQLQYITKQKYRVFNRGTLSFMGLCAGYVLLSRVIDIDEFAYFLVVVIVQTVMFFEFVVRVLWEGTDILGIRVFSLRPLDKKKTV